MEVAFGGHFYPIAIFNQSGYFQLRNVLLVAMPVLMVTTQLTDSQNDVNLDGDEF